jgi:F-type H+-transporting ATPase subunit epsilon
MTFTILTKEGVHRSGETDYVVLKNREGEMAILNDHIPIIVHIDSGHLKFVSDDTVMHTVVESAVVEFKDNRLSVVALDAITGDTLEDATRTFEDARRERLEKTKRENVDFSDLERELKENIRKSKAGSV